jgi:hypothetical protein
MSSPRPTPWLLAVLLAPALGGLLPAPAAAAPRPFPRTGLYGSVVGPGFPYVRSDGSLDTLEIGRASRVTEITLDVYPISPYRPDIVAAMRARNPNLVVLAYVLAQDIWPSEDPDSLNHIPTLIRHTVRDLDGYLYDKNTGQEYAGTNINIAKKGTNGHFIVAEALANIFRDHIIATGTWDGIFTDLFAHTVGWTQAGTGKVIDFQRAGYATLADLDIAWSAACDTLAAHLRRDGGPGFVLVGNGGPSAEHSWYDGWMRENFPHQQGGTWASNMLGDVSSRGYFRDDIDFVQPPHNWIFSAASGIAGQEYSIQSTTAVRFGLASAALGEGVHCFGPGDKNVRTAPYQDWWYDEYAVDITTGQSSEALAQTGWLGDALGAAYNFVWPGTAPDAITNTSFESDVTSGWTFQATAPASATISRDATTAAVGTASARVHIATASTVEWHVYLNSVGQLNVFAGNSYAATFRCKASAPRTIRVLAGNSGGSQQITVDTNWRQYQVVLTPTTSMAASLAFFLGTQAGDVWFDDVHFQAGATSVWRRDFQNGIVLVNPTELSLTVPLEVPFRRILGTHAPAVNDGVLSATNVIPPHDALFLLRASTDRTRPAAVLDLRVGP